MNAHLRSRAPTAALLGGVLLALGVAPASRAQERGSITVHPVARVEPGRPVTLADIAALDGAGATALGDVVLLDAAEPAWRTLDLDTIRQAIDAHAAPAWGHLVLSGGACRIRAAVPVSAPETPGDAPEIDAAPLYDPTTVRGVIEQRLALALACDRNDLRLDFDERDANLLATSALARTVDAQPTGFSARMPLRVEIFEGERLIDSRAIRVGVLVRREVLVAPAPLERGEVLSTESLTSEQRWLEPDIRPLAPAEAAGLILRARIAPGQVLEARHAELPLLARRGQTITAHAVDGAVSLQIPARALEEGRAGEVIRCETIGPSSSARRRDPAREILVRLAAPGVGVVVTRDDDPAPIDHASPPPPAPETFP